MVAGVTPSGNPNLIASWSDAGGISQNDVLLLENKSKNWAQQCGFDPSCYQQMITCVHGSCFIVLSPIQPDDARTP